MSMIVPVSCQFRDLGGKTPAFMGDFRLRVRVPSSAPICKCLGLLVRGILLSKLILDVQQLRSDNFPYHSKRGKE